MVTETLQVYNNATFVKLKSIIESCSGAGFCTSYALCVYSILKRFKGTCDVNFLMYWCIKKADLNFMVALLAWRKMPATVLDRAFQACYEKIFAPNNEFEATLNSLRSMLVLLGACGANTGYGLDEFSNWSTDIVAYLVACGKLTAGFAREMMASGSLQVKRVVMKFDHYVPQRRWTDYMIRLRRGLEKNFRMKTRNLMTSNEKKSACMAHLCVRRSFSLVPQEIVNMILWFCAPERQDGNFSGLDMQPTEMHAGIVY